MLCSVYTTIAGEYDGPGFCTPIGMTYKYAHTAYDVHMSIYNNNALALPKI